MAYIINKHFQSIWFEHITEITGNSRMIFPWWF
jgi:hypothetical protein